ncbi:MAG: TonB-dependent receptor [Prevotellaceae bacterium]|jgi:TonB-linked SusC/RagA family outer membrane protein|nr:TonB-dependent receptor [Prevotellaceae bacterium]
MRKIIPFLCLILLFGNVALTAQDRISVTGVVSDESGQSLVGASVLEAGTTNLQQTNSEGRFVLQTSIGSALQVSFVGYITQTVTVRSNIMEIVMKADPQSLDEVVIVAYGQQKKASVVGAVQTIRASELRVPTTQLTTSFAGRLAGVIAVQRSGEPGADGANFWIRGVSTTTGVQNPLIIIDGVQASSGDLNNIAPEMIDNFSVLKDATATALYGTLGANGVLIVNTKSGVTSGKPIINVRVEQMFKQPLKVPKTVGGVEYMQLFNEAVGLRGSSKLAYQRSKIEATAAGLDPLVYPNVDWYKEMFDELSTAQVVNLNVRGGSLKADYYLGVNISNENGLLKGRSKEFYSFDNSISQQKYVFQNNVNVNLTKTSKISLRINTQLRSYTGNNMAVGDVFDRIMRSNPVDFPILYPMGDTRQSQLLKPDHIMWGGTPEGQNFNPLADMVSGVKENFESTVIATLSFDQKLDMLVQGLSANVLASFKNWSKTGVNKTISATNKYAINSHVLDANNQLVSYDLAPIGSPTTPVLNTANDNNAGDRTVYLQGQLNYDRTFAEVHSLQAMLLYNQRQYNNNIPGASLISSLPQRKQGIAGRVSYSYDRRYMAELNFGYNGSENFAKGHRWGFFPSIAGGYNISEEKFWEPLKAVVSSMKLRASYGLVGNDQTSAGTRFLYMENITLQDGTSIGDNGRRFKTGIEMNRELGGPKYNRYANPGITWEIGKKLNLGVDLRFFKDLYLTFEWFSEHRNNIFGTRGTIPNFLGTGSTEVYGNLQEVKNNGIDFSMNYDKQLNKNLFLSLRGTFTYAHNTVLDLDEPAYLQYPNLSRVGHQIGQPQLLIAERLFIDQAEIDNSPQQSWGTLVPGDIKYKDMPDVSGQKNNMVDANDRIFTGYPSNPEIVYGFGGSVRWKNWDFSMFWQGTARVSLVMSGFHPFGTSSDRDISTVLSWVAADHWSPSNPNPFAKYPALSVNAHANTTQASTYWLRDASFLKLKNLELGYSYKFFRIYAAASNILTISKFKLWDPEQGGGSGVKYPNQRILNIGLQMNF